MCVQAATVDSDSSIIWGNYVLAKPSRYDISPHP